MSDPVMLYCTDHSIHPLGEILEEINYTDQNDFVWKIKRDHSGFLVHYLGDPYFSDKYFSCDLKNGKHILLNNTRCIYFKDTSFETFVKVRDAIKSRYTDDIWEMINDMLTSRLNHDSHLWSTEIVRNDHE